MTPADQDGREQRGEHTRLALLRAARLAFGQKGFRGASVRDIARAAEVHPALVTYHFKSKARLWEQVVDGAMGTLRDRLLAVVARPHASVRDAAVAALHAYLDHLEAEPDFPRLVVRGLLDEDPVVLGIATRHLRPLAEAGAALPGSSDVLVSLFGAAVAPYVYGPLLAGAFGTDPLTPESQARRRAHLVHLTDVLLAQLEAPWPT